MLAPAATQNRMLRNDEWNREPSPTFCTMCGRSVYGPRPIQGSPSPPSCVIDINNIIDAKTRRRLSYRMVRLSDHFTLQEMTHQSARSSPYVYVDPSFIRRLEETRQAYGSAIHVNSGFRSPAHLCPESLNLDQIRQFRSDDR